MKFNSLADVQAHQWTGHGGAEGEADHDAFVALHKYLQTDAPFAERAEAINHAFAPYTSIRDTRDPEVVVTQYLREWVHGQDDS